MGGGGGGGEGGSRMTTLLYTGWHVSECILPRYKVSCQRHKYEVVQLEIKYSRTMLIRPSIIRISGLTEPK